MSPQQEKIASYLSEHRDRDVTATELRDKLAPSATVKTIHVQVHRMRGENAPIQSKGSPVPGYRWTGAGEFCTHGNDSAIDDEMPESRPPSISLAEHIACGDGDD